MDTSLKNTTYLWTWHPHAHTHTHSIISLPCSAAPRSSDVKKPYPGIQLVLHRDALKRCQQQQAAANEGTGQIYNNEDKNRQRKWNDDMVSFMEMPSRCIRLTSAFIDSLILMDNFSIPKFNPKLITCHSIYTCVTACGSIMSVKSTSSCSFNSVPCIFVTIFGSSGRSVWWSESSFHWHD